MDDGRRHPGGHAHDQRLRALTDILSRVTALVQRLYVVCGTRGSAFLHALMLILAFLSCIPCLHVPFPVSTLFHAPVLSGYEDIPPRHATDLGLTAPACNISMCHLFNPDTGEGHSSLS